MLKYLLPTAAACTFSGAVLAGSLDTPAPVITAVAPVAAAVTDWSGFYLGGMYSWETGDQLYSDDGQYDLVNSAPGAFAGYNLQNNRFVYGGEVAYIFGGVHQGVSTGFTFSHYIDLKARAGYVLGDALLYGVAGWSLGQWEEGDPTDSFASGGFNAGVGVDYLVTDRVFIGAEYLFRNQASQWSTDPSDTHSVDIQSVSVRAGLKF